jgi:SAM-dependent methyltransferase
MKLETMLPHNPSEEIKRGEKLYGDDLSSESIREWESLEAEGFANLEKKNRSALHDPWYDYQRYLNELYVWRIVETIFSPDQELSMLVLGPGTGEELDDFFKKYKNLKLEIVEPSKYFCGILAKKFPNAVINSKLEMSLIGKKKYDVVIAIQVFHHIANVNNTLRKISAALQVGGLLFTREPCSSMGLWSQRVQKLHINTPNERGISKRYLVETALNNNLYLYKNKNPIPIGLDPLNRFLRKSGAYRLINNNIAHMFDRVISFVLGFNDCYWRTTWRKKFGPSAYHYIFVKNHAND